MPEMNGFEATDYIRKTMKSQIPIIALTADVTKADVPNAKNLDWTIIFSNLLTKTYYIVGISKKVTIIIDVRI
jgi:two-component system CheB/CheR fusion protein